MVSIEKERATGVPQTDIEDLKLRLEQLEQENRTLKEARLAERGKAADALAEQERRYKTLFNSIDEGFCIIEFFDGPFGLLSDYIHIEANDAYTRHTGIPNVVGQKVREMVPDEAGGWVELYRGVLLTGSPIRFERELVATARHLELAAFRIEPPSLKQVAVLFQDITARKRAEADLQKLNETLEHRIAEAVSERTQIEDALRQSQKMEAVGQLTGGIAHDFNNMLAVILSSMRLAERRLQRGDADVAHFLKDGIRGAERAAKLVTRLLSFSRRQPLAPQRVDANRLLSEMEEVMRRTIPENIGIEFVRSAGLWPTFADAHGLESALINLAVNARDAMADGGKLTIETSNAYLDDEYTASYADLPPGQYVLVSVTDTGVGISPDNLSRVFEPFFTTKDVGAGTGLGLSQVYGFMKQSGGHVKIYSEVGVGTTVKLYLPRLSDGTVDRTPKPASSAVNQRGNGELVLVVEDEDDVRRVTTEILTEIGYSVVAANGAEAALALIDQHPELKLLMTDVVMPGMNGRKLADQALQKRPDLKVLFTTGYSRNAIVHNGVLDQGVELIVKPYTFEALAAKVAKVLAGR